MMRSQAADYISKCAADQNETTLPTVFQLHLSSSQTEALSFRCSQSVCEAITPLPDLTHCWSAQPACAWRAYDLANERGEIFNAAWWRKLNENLCIDSFYKIFSQRLPGI